MSAANCLSVVIPCYNGEAYLRDAIDSALNQTHPNLEVIVVDDGSTDSSAQIMADYGSRVRVVRQPNTGLPAARNAGIAVARGTYLAFLDADDYWAPRFAECCVRALDESAAAIAYSGWQNIGLSGGRGKPFVPPDYEREPSKLERLLEGVRWPVHAAVVRSEIVQEVGGFDTKWSSCEDFAFWLEAALTRPLVRVPEVLVYYRHHEGEQMTHKRARIARNHWLVQREFMGRHPDLAAQLGRRRMRQLTHGELLRKGYVCYWDRDMEAAREIFRLVMRSAYGGFKDWKYMLPALLPLWLHRKIVGLFDRRGAYVT